MINKPDPRFLYKTEPHGEHTVLLIEEDENPGQRIYSLRSSDLNHVELLGEEFADLCRWFAQEPARPVKEELLPLEPDNTRHIGDEALEAMKPGERWGTESNYRIPIAKLREFSNKLVKLAEQFFGRDCDYDLPVQIEIIDRTRREAMHYMALPYDHTTRNEDLTPSFQDALFNLRIATERLRNILDIQRYRDDQGERQTKKPKHK
ncbi:MAG: hypothetical protein L0312_20135 [Acidobacteria bacterium]|nr:hypothetical protein [Acidobacteriota bacterium]